MPALGLIKSLNCQLCQKCNCFLESYPLNTDQVNCMLDPNYLVSYPRKKEASTELKTKPIVQSQALRGLTICALTAHEFSHVLIVTLCAGGEKRYQLNACYLVYKGNKDVRRYCYLERGS